MNPTKAAHEVSNGISDLLHGAGERFVDLKDESVKTLGKRLDMLGKLMKKHPLIAIAIGVGGGYLLGRFLRRG